MVHLATTYLRPEWRRVLLLALLLGGSIALQLVNPQLLRSFIDTARAGGAGSALTAAALVFLGVALAAQVVSVGESHVATDLAQRATNALRADLTLHCLHLDSAWHNAHTPGELIERIDGDVGTLSNFFSRFAVDLLGNLLLLAGVLILLYRVDWWVGLVYTGLTVVALLLIRALNPIPTRYRIAARQASAELYGFLEERLAGTEDLRSAGAVPYAMRRLYERLRVVVRTEVLARSLGSLFANVTLSLFTLGTAIAFLLGAYLFHAGLATLGTVYLLFAYTQMLQRPIEQLHRQAQDFQGAAAAVSRIVALLAVQPTILDPVAERIAPDGQGTSRASAAAVEFDGVSFRYGRGAEAEAVLRDVSFRLAPGEVLGLLGRTGSGKSTISRLLFRLYDPSGGAIRLDGIDLRDLPLAEVRRRVGIVSQEVQLFHASVRDNLTFFDASSKDEAIRRVLDELGLGDWYKTLPHGLNTRLAPGGGGLSAGEAQLLAFARIGLQDPGLVILDEASSRLDPATERLLERAVDALLAGRTAIVIAHRLATIQRADSILILEGGRVVEHGPRAALAADPRSRLAALLHTGLEVAPV
jgi:ABC-type multidrug transport system fused ATPase/permease subunit